MGFSWAGSESNGSLDAKTKTVAVVATHTTNLGPGDAVVIQGNAVDGVRAVDAAVAGTAAAGASITGIVSAVRPNYEGEQLSITHLPSARRGMLEINVDPFALYEVDVSGGTLTEANVGQNTNLVPTAGTVSGSVFRSNMTISGASAQIGTADTKPFRIVGLLKDSAGVLGNRALVRVNATTSRPGATGV